LVPSQTVVFERWFCGKSEKPPRPMTFCKVIGLALCLKWPAIEKSEIQKLLTEIFRYRDGISVGGETVKHEGAISADADASNGR
jgi:hypothetical protein